MDNLMHNFNRMNRIKQLLFIVCVANIDRSRCSIEINFYIGYVCNKSIQKYFLKYYLSIKK